ncbi:MAG: tetratricopeptide repeat protein, partial [Armatimonadetes bacterium]|nr:tetratricopeptide repeat protein [Armatimonadota bacterium]
ALCYRRKGDLGRALATMARAVEMAPEEADVLLEHGLIMIESGRVQEGLDVLRQAVHVSGHDPVYRHELYLQNALALYSEGFMEAAALSLRKALKFSEDPDTYRVQIQVLTEWGRPEEALEVVAEAQTKFPRDGALHHIAGLALAAARRPYEAAQAFVRAYELGPGNVDPVHSLALVFESAGDVHRALETLERCLGMQMDEVMREDVLQRISRIRAKMMGVE